MKNEVPTFVRGSMIPQLGKASKLINMMVKAQFLAHGIPLTKEQFIVLLCLEEEPKPQSFLAFITERNKGSLTRLVQSLEKKGYVHRKVSEVDSRVNHVEVTSNGRNVLEQSKPLIKNLFARLQQGVNKKDKQIAMKVIAIIQDNAIKEIEKIEYSK